jgi:hypothetical protein
MLAFDIETTGTDVQKDDMTCASVYDPERGISRVFVFCTGDSLEEFTRMLDEADRLCAFNGAQFDIPFIQRVGNISDARVRVWRLKLHDVFESCRLGLGKRFSLDALLELNGLETKTGSGLEAIRMAREKDWDGLRKYSIRDSELTHEVSSLDVIKLPRAPQWVFSKDGRFRRA